MGQELLQEDLGEHLGGPGQHPAAGAALQLQRPPQHLEAGAAAGGAGADSARALPGPPEWGPAQGVPAVPPSHAAAPVSAVGPACGW